MRNRFQPAGILLVITAFLAACAPYTAPATPAPTTMPTMTAAVEATATTIITVTATAMPVVMPTTTAPPAKSPAPLPLIAAGAAHTCLADSAGKVACWGDNQFGQLGGGSGRFRLLEFAPRVDGMASWFFMDVPLEQPVASIAAGFYHTCAATEDGQVHCWGRNDSGALGSSSTEDSPSPVRVQGLSGPAVALSAGADHTCALLEDGAVQCWGDNSNGQLGSGDVAASNTPLTVKGLDGAAKQVVAGIPFSCAVMETGQLICWGRGINGLFGSTVPGEVPPITPPNLLALEGRVDTAVAGQYHLCALMESGAVNCWGGLLSNEEYIPAKPMVISGLVDGITSWSAGGGYTCALTGMGRVRCWGDNYFGQLGDGSDRSSWEPVEPQGLASGALTVAAGSGHACAAMQDGSLRCWGDPSAGQLGDSAIRWLALRNTYTSEKYAFSIDFPAGWKVLEVPNEQYLASVDQIWFSSDEFPPPQTGARPEIAITITSDDPSKDWQPRLFENYRSEIVQIGEIEAVSISGTNREMRSEERVVIVPLQSGVYLQILPNGSPQSLNVFDQMVASLRW